MSAIICIWYGKTITFVKPLRVLKIFSHPYNVWLYLTTVRKYVIFSLEEVIFSPLKHLLSYVRFSKFNDSCHCWQTNRSDCYLIFRVIYDNNIPENYSVKSYNNLFFFDNKYMLSKLCYCYLSVIEFDIVKTGD